jgi:hypothetical protein
MISEKSFVTYADGPLDIASENADLMAFLQQHVANIKVTDTSECSKGDDVRNDGAVT